MADKPNNGDSLQENTPTIKPSKKSLILDAALCSFVENGITNTSTASIAKRAGVATGTLFHHFANKQLLCDELYREIKTQLSTDINQDLSGDLYSKGQTLWLKALEWFINNPNALRFLQRYYLNLEAQTNRDANKTDTLALFKELHQYIYDFFEQCQKEGLMIDMPLDYLALMAQNSIFSNAEFLLLFPSYNTKAFKQQACRSALSSLIITH
ncbi:TetR/AcrR family transcriptional regulator [Vibrio tapetis subsp. quintayensis]|uniref:TetR/AcrR family transcriptional regulator n=1 Tax=Vibrio tapetis TaxID=52443 RepID=UPI0025B2BA90|nr:TetR/AcrR family transcriptional regulator [Vibrio tapetis]MDN3680244.1 TetR/AcrR family transcriptional regulator [Vibrio tapetis subsp. quintayensis]